MAITIYNIKKWYKMMMGQSILHVNQNIGKVFSTSEVKGYYNDLTEKVTRLPELLGTDKLPQMQIPSGELITFSVGVFQYGLGAYDLFLMTGNKDYYDKFWQVVKWTINNQEPNGAWDTFSWLTPTAAYGAMAQGEALSLLTRAYQESSDVMYLDAAIRAINFLIKPVEEGGCTLYKGDDVILLEYTDKAAVLNGWIFAWWGLYDYVQVSKDPYVEQCCRQSLHTLERTLHKFSNSYWSLYDLSNKIASPFYHKLHIAQMQAMFQLTGLSVFKEYEQLWESRRKNPLCKVRAFIYKSWQKIKE